MTWGEEELGRLLRESKNSRGGPDELAAWLEDLGIEGTAFARISKAVGMAALKVLAEVADKDAPIIDDAYAAVGAAFAGGFELGVMFEQERAAAYE